VDRPTAKAWHIDSSIVLAVGLPLVVLASRRRFARTARGLHRFDGGDTQWLPGAPRRLLAGRAPPPPGRLHAGQKLNAALVGGLMGVMYVTGFLLWEGERDTAYRFAGTVTVHDWAMWILIVLVFGHIYLAVLNPATRHALRGMTLGDVDRA